MSGNETSSYCRDIESYLCQKNGGHLVRVVGPSFEVVSRWAAAGVPVKVAFQGIDRYAERYFRHGPRRRPIRIDFCDADVMDVFDEWRRALGLAADRVSEPGPFAPEDEVRSGPHRGPSLPVHLERVLLRLSSARAQGRLDAAADQLLDRVSNELDAARASGRGLRGAARLALISRLAALDSELMAAARASLDPDLYAELGRQADEELGPFRDRMAADRFARARETAVERLIRERLALPTVAFD